jgi:tryptophan synthase alpha chain
MGVEQVAAVFQNITGRAAFMPYVVPGYPSLEESLEVIRTLVACGADLLELGVPFSDPLADGPVIQNATQQALTNGITLQHCIDLVAGLRADGITTPVLLMSYVNPILAYGVDRCVRSAAEAGADGFIVPDLPPEEAEVLETACVQQGVALVYLLAPTSSAARIEQVARRSSGFIYLVSLTGVTGARSELAPGLAEFVGRVRLATSLPLAVGFGIGNGDQAASVAQLADGVIVGSALVRAAGQSPAGVRSLGTEIRIALE